MNKIYNIALVGHLFYPQQTPRAMRMTELAKELAKQGHHVVVYCLKGSCDYTEFERNFGVEVINIGTPIIGLGTSSTNYTKSVATKQSSSIRSRVRSAMLKQSRKLFCFPEIELTRLVKAIISTDYLRYDAIISIGRPYEIHWGVALAKSSKKNFPFWISDCGDPFMGNPFNQHPFYFKWVEEWWGRNCDAITVPIDEAKKAYYPSVQDKLYVIPQGFNFEGIDLADYQPNAVPTFVYAGALYKGLRDPDNLLKYLSKLKKSS